MNVELKTQKHNVIDSGIVFVPIEEDSVEFHIQANETFSFVVALKFVDKEGAEQNMKADIQGDVITFTCTNFKNEGTGTKECMELATVSGKKIYLLFWYYKMSEKSPRKIEYTFLQER